MFLPYMSQKQERMSSGLAFSNVCDVSFGSTINLGTEAQLSLFQPHE